MSADTTDDAAPLAGATVLVVDDHLPNIQLLERILRRGGVAAVHATRDPTGVVELYHRTSPDLVLLDLHMPGMDGVAVMQALAAATPPDDFVPVVVLTADATAQARERVLAAGAADFLTKPFDQVEVTLRAQNLLQRRALTVQLAAHNAKLRAEVEEQRAADARRQREAQESRDRVGTALADGGLRMVFQAIAELGSRTVVGHEALARFDVPPPRPPDVWFAEASAVGLGERLELGAVRAAIAAYDGAGGDGLLAVNVSPRTVVAPAFAQLLADTRRTRIVLEITEHAPVQDYDSLLAVLAELRAEGARLAVDDAGAGFASLSHILRLCPDIIKLDISLTRDVDADPVKRALTAALVAFSADIGATLLAEGIETEAELVCLEELGVSWGQGYHLARPDALPSAGTA